MQGIQVWDSSNKLVLDSSYRTTSIFGSISISSTGTFTVSDDRFSKGVPFYLMDDFYNGITLVAVFSNNTYTFTLKNSGLGTYAPFKIYYGVF